MHLTFFEECALYQAYAYGQAMNELSSTIKERS
jgi:hypothetical protein